MRIDGAGRDGAIASASPQSDSAGRRRRCSVGHPLVTLGATSNCANGGLRYTFLGNSGPRGVSFSNTTTATVITGLTITFWLRSSTLNGMWGNTMPLAWSNPAYSGATRVVNGVTYYGYVAKYLQTIAPVNGTTIIRYNFNICIPLAFSGDRLIQTDAVVNGSSQSIITGVLPALPPNVTVTE